MSDTSMAASTRGRERILAESFRLFADRGYSGVSMQQIADAVGVTKATLYHHFQDKEDLFAQVMHNQFNHSQSILAQSVEEAIGFRHKLIAFGQVMFSAERTDLSRLFGDFHRYVAQERQTSFWATFERPWTYLEGPIAAAIAEREVAPGDPALIARICFSAFVGQMQIARYEANIPCPTPPMAEEIASVLLAGLTPR